MLIKNKNRLATSSLGKAAIDIIEAGISSVLPDKLLKSAVNFDSRDLILQVQNQKYDTSTGRIFVIGGGKASGLMAQALEKIIGSANITGGVVNSKVSTHGTEKINVVQAGHPVPDERGIDGVRQMLALKQQYDINENDVIIALISGGGSALMPCPIEGIGLQDKQRITDLLIKSGAEIGEINAVRKHLSQVKGGKLGGYFQRSRIISLILSDVIGNDLSVIASGLTVPQRMTRTGLLPRSRPTRPPGRG